MPGRVEADPYIVLGLELGERRALGDRVADARRQVVDLDLQVHHHLLVVRAGGPDGPDVPRFGLEVQALPAARRPQYHPAGFFGAGRPAEEPTVEVGERVGVGRVDVDPGHG
jgi:hypothetical protein